MNITAIEKEELEKLTNAIFEIKDSLVKRDEEEFSSSIIESKKIPKLLGISPKTWQNYRDKGVIPFIQLGAKIWVKRSDIENFLNNHYINKTA
jgi:lipopolysaccharide biosynthesis protein